MSEQSKYLIRGYCSDGAGGYDEETYAETLKEAKQRARHLMTEEHLRCVESTIPVKYVEIVHADTGRVVADFGERN